MPDSLVLARSEAPAGFRFGTHRRRPPAATLALVRPIAARCGITRLADVTGLDTIGIPVFQAIRPLARSISVSQGKGVTRVAARVSALMEAIELHHAETIEPTDLEEGRCHAVDLLSGRTMRVPHALVSMDFARGEASIASSNGLASGNDRGEAIAAALAEVIERDAQSRWLDCPAAERHLGAIDPDTITSPLGRRLLRLVRAAGLGLRLWSFGEEHEVAAIACALYELAPEPVLAPVMGAGAHLDPLVALVRAVTEAAQARATLIAGARDDLAPRDYEGAAALRLRLLIDSLSHGSPSLDWATLPRRASGCLARDVDGLLAGAEAAGARRIACVDLSDPALPIAVVKLIVPGFLDRVHRRGAAA